MKKAIARILCRVLRAVYSRLDDVDVAYSPMPPLTGICADQRYEIRVHKSGTLEVLRSEIAVLEEIKEEMTY